MLGSPGYGPQHVELFLGLMDRPPTPPVLVRLDLAGDHQHG